MKVNQASGREQVFVLLLILPILHASESMCRVKEHSPINTIVCSINNVLVGGKQNLYLFSYKNLFKINSANQLLVVNSIDRESFDTSSCVPGPDNGVPPYCRINVELINKTKPQDLQVIQIHIDIEDINDNYPTFDKMNYSIDIDENIPAGHIEQLPVARDIDYGINGEIVYSIEGKDKTFFNLVQTNRHKPMIKTLRMFDRETKDKYELTLIAADKGDPKRTSEVKLFIRIRDLNDNVPEFNFLKDTIIGVKEDEMEGTKIADIKVIDKDADSVVNVYLDTNADSDVKKHFQVSATNGITLLFHLNYESPLKKFTIPIIAVDNGTPSLTSSVTLIINVLDVNDNNPIITIDSLSEINTNFKVTENKPKETFVAMVTVQDDDSGVNGIVECSLAEPTSKQHFELISQSYSEIQKQRKNYKIVTVQEFDREKATHYQVTIKCRDQGLVALSSQQTITVWIEDENDNAPSFARQHYQGSIRENSLPGTKIFVLQATDADIGSNANILYSIDSRYNDLVTVNSPSSGVVTSVIPFDREANKSITFRAYAIDEKNHFLNSSVDVTIDIEDENDCSPIFELNSYMFKVKEGHTGWIGKVVAYDNDSSSNGQVSFVLTGLVRNNLWIVRADGNIFSERGHLLDREVQNLHHITVEARDHGSPVRSSSVIVQVQLEDVNDNAPKFIQPSDARYSLTVNDAMVPGSLVTKVIATDDDENGNARISYYILNNDYFFIDENSGEIYINKTLARSDYSRRRLVVIAKDSGTPRLSSTLFISVTLQQDSEDRDVLPTNQNPSPERNNQELRKRNPIDNNGFFRWNSKEVLITLTVGSVLLILCCAAFLLLYIWYQSRPMQNGKANDLDDTEIDMATSPVKRNCESTSCSQWFCLSRAAGKPGKSLLVSSNSVSRQQQKIREISLPLGDGDIHVNDGEMDAIMHQGSPFTYKYKPSMIDMKHSSDSLDSSTFNKPNTHFTNIYEPPLRAHKHKSNQNYSTIELPVYNTMLSNPTVQVYNNMKYESQFPHCEQQNLNSTKNSYFVSNFAVPNPRINNSFV